MSDAVGWLVDHKNIYQQDSCAFISLTPMASYALEREGIQHSTVLDYTGDEERFLEGLQTYSILDEIISDLDMYLQDSQVLPKLKPSSYPYFFLKKLLDIIFMKVHIIQTIIDKESPDKMYITVNELPPKAHNPYYFSFDDEPVFSYILSCKGWPIKCRTVLYPPQNVHQKKRRICSSAKETVWQLADKIKNIDYFFNMGLIYKRQGLKKLVPEIINSVRTPGGGTVVICGSGYNWDDSLPEFYQTGIKPVLRLKESGKTVNPETLSKLYEQVLEICKKSEALKKYSYYRNIDLFPLLSKKIAEILSNTLIDYAAGYNQFQTLMDTSKIKCLLLSTQVRPFDQGAISAAHDNNVPVISWQHGGAGYSYHPIMPYAEFVNSDIHLVFGDGVKWSYLDTAQERHLMPLPRFVSVGSSSLDLQMRRARKRPRKNGRPRILYITEYWGTNMTYISTRFDPVKISERLWSFQRAMLDLATRHPESDFIIKLHPADISGEPVRSYVKDQSLCNVTIITNERTAVELMEKCDIIVIDFIATSILQALVLEKTMFVYSGMYEIDRVPLELIKKRAYTFDKIDELLTLLHGFLIKDPKIPALHSSVDNQNTEFIRRYGTFNHDGKSAKRAVKIIRDAIEAHKKIIHDFSVEKVQHHE
jgi:hypothetical protein